MKPKIKTGLALSIIPQIIFVKWFGNYPELVEKYYSEGIYPIISKFLRLLFGWVPFSVGDIFYTILGIAIVRYVYLNAKSFRKQPKKIAQHVGITLSLAYFIFHLFWGMNYYRLPVNEKLGFNVGYTKEELVSFTLDIIGFTNHLQMKLTKDSIQPVKIPYSNKEIYTKTVYSYETAVAKAFPYFKYQIPSLKSSLYSVPLTYMGYGGYLNPFTNEAQVNAIVPKLRLPSISGHEVGHQLGYSSESSTNYIGLVVTFSNPDSYFKYGALTHLLAYCLSDLKVKDEQLFNVLFAKLSEGVKKNYQELSSFWEQYQNPTEPIFKAIFNVFLKANNQDKGIESYNAVVGLLINTDKKFWYSLYWDQPYLQK